MTPECPRVRWPWVWLALPILSWVALVLIGYWPTRAYGGPGGVQAMLAGQMLVLAVVYVTLIPAMAKMAVVGSADRLKIGFKAATVRFLFTLVLAGLIVWRGKVALQSFLIWVAVAYVVMIQLETLVLVRWARMLERA